MSASAKQSPRSTFLKNYEALWKASNTDELKDIMERVLRIISDDKRKHHQELMAFLRPNDLEIAVPFRGRNVSQAFGANAQTFQISFQYENAEYLAHIIQSADFTLMEISKILEDGLAWPILAANNMNMYHQLKIHLTPYYYSLTPASKLYFLLSIILLIRRFYPNSNPDTIVVRSNDFFNPMPETPLRDYMVEFKDMYPKATGGGRLKKTQTRSGSRKKVSKS